MDSTFLILNNPTREKAFPSTNPRWDYNQKEHQRERTHFFICIKGGLKAAQHKATNYSQVTAISQEAGEFQELSLTGRGKHY